MPHKIAIDESVDCFFVEWAGTVLAEELISYFSEIVRHPEFRSGMNSLHDFRDARVHQSQDDLDAIARSYAEVRPEFADGKFAVLVTSDLSFDAARVFLTLADLKPGLSGVYRDYELAKAWLGLPAAYVGPFVGSEDPGEQR